MLAHFALALALASPLAQGQEPALPAPHGQAVPASQPAAAEPYVPPGQGGPPFTGSPDPALAAGTAGGWEWGLGLLVGRTSGWWSERAAGADPRVGLEGSLLARLGERLALGGMITTGGGIGAHALASVRFRLSPGLRLDALAQAGATRQELSAREIHLAPTFGGRAGITFARPEGGRYVTLGVAARRALPDRDVPVVCGPGLEPCGSEEWGGGTIVGAFVTVGGAHRRGR